MPVRADLFIASVDGLTTDEVQDRTKAALDALRGSGLSPAAAMESATLRTAALLAFLAFLALVLRLALFGLFGPLLVPPLPGRRGVVGRSVGSVLTEVFSHAHRGIPPYATMRPTRMIRISTTSSP
jgi:hypothetical protein